jgi:hypothetical protein
MGTGAPTLDQPISPRRVPHRHVLRAREVVVCAGIAAAAWFLCGAVVGTSPINGGWNRGASASLAADATGHHGNAIPAGRIAKRSKSGIGDHIAEAARPVPAKPSPAAVTAFYRRAKERAAKLMGKPAPKWKVCPGCELAFRGTDTVAENPASGHTPGDWQP